MKNIKFEAHPSGPGNQEARGRRLGGSAALKRGPAALSDAARAKKKNSTPIASDRAADKGGDDDDTYRKHMMMTRMIQETQVAYGGRSLVGQRVWRRWLSHGLTKWL